MDQRRFVQNVPARLQEHTILLETCIAVSGQFRSVRVPYLSFRDNYDEDIERNKSETWSALVAPSVFYFIENPITSRAAV